MGLNEIDYLAEFTLNQIILNSPHSARYTFLPINAQFLMVFNESILSHFSNHFDIK